jgi:hypothetical protein
VERAYGGGWALVNRLLEASRRAARRTKRWQWLLLMPFLLVGSLGVMVFVDTTLHSSSEAADAIVLVLMVVPLACAAVILATQLAIDYSRQFIRSDRIRTFIAPAVFGPIAIGYGFVGTNRDHPYLSILACVAAAGVMAIWAAVMIGRLLLKVPSIKRWSDSLVRAGQAVRGWALFWRRSYKPLPDHRS